MANKPFFSEVMLRTSSHGINAETVKAAFHWADALDDPTAAVPSPLPQFPENPEVDPFEAFLSGWAKGCAKAGLDAAQKIGHNPLAPHLIESARPGASTFNPGSSPLDWEPGQYDLIRVEGGPGVRIFIMRAPWNIGVNRTTSIDPEAEYVLKEVHGWLQPVGPTRETENEICEFSVILTWEGDEIGWVDATVHPGPADPKVDRSNLTAGQTVKGSVLISKGFVRAIPEAGNENA